jgi:ribosomal protein S18 acetylase RimI-like enzyme
VLPGRLGTEAETAVFARIVDYLRGRGVELLLTRVDTRYKAKERLLERLGFTKTEYQNHGMERDPRGVEPPDPPAGTRIRVARMPEEIETLWRVYAAAFATRERHVPMSLESFRRSRHFQDPDNASGVYVAEREDGTPVGMVLSAIDKAYNAEHGVRRGGSYALAVVPAERKRGLGTALLLRSVRWIADAGMDIAYLSVNVANPDALRIYERAGYRSVQVYQGYGLRIA